MTTNHKTGHRLGGVRNIGVVSTDVQVSDEWAERFQRLAPDVFHLPSPPSDQNENHRAPS